METWREGRDAPRESRVVSWLGGRGAPLHRFPRRSEVTGGKKGCSGGGGGGRRRKHGFRGLRESRRGWVPYDEDSGPSRGRIAHGLAALGSLVGEEEERRRSRRQVGLVGVTPPRCSDGTGSAVFSSLCAGFFVDRHRDPTSPGSHLRVPSREGKRATRQERCTGLSHGFLPGVSSPRRRCGGKAWAQWTAHCRGMMRSSQWNPLRRA